MRAVAFKEIGSYYNTMTGYVYMAICLLVCGIFFAAENIGGGSASFLGVVSAISYVLILITPILTMKSFAEERKTKTDQMFLTAPISVTKVVIGKFLAAMTVLFITLTISLVYRGDSPWLFRYYSVRRRIYIHRNIHIVHFCKSAFGMRRDLGNTPVFMANGYDRSVLFKPCGNLGVSIRLPI